MLIAEILGPLALWATWLAWFGLLAGIGLGIRRALLRIVRIDASAVFASFWIGFLAVTTFLIVQHFFLPITTGSLLLVVLVACAALWWNMSPLLHWLRGIGRWRVYRVLGVLMVLGWWMALHGVQAVAAFDTHLYLVPAVEWFTQYALPPGLANLHGRFGFNTGTLPFAAMLEHGPWVDASTYLVNGIFVTAFTFRVATSLSEWPMSGPGRRVRCAFDALLAVPLLAMVASPVLFRSLEADLPSTIAIFSALSLMVGRIGRAPFARADLLVAAGFAATLAATIKLSAAVAAVALWAIALAWLLRPHNAEPVRRPVTLLFAGSAILAVAWITRGVLLSGYPFYPFDLFSVPVDWRVPVEQVHASHDWVRVFARGYFDAFQFNDVRPALMCGTGSWVRPWLRHLFTSAYWWQVPLPIALTLIVAAVGLRSPASRRALRRAVPLGATLVVAGVVWFLTAPRPDFGLPLAWSLAALSFACTAIVAGGPAVPPRAASWRVPAAVALFLAAVPLAGFSIRAARVTRANRVRAAVLALLPRASDGNWLVPTQWDWPLREYRTPAGLRLYLAEQHRCSRAPVPCTSHPADNLRLRRPGDLSSGFAVPSGEWHAERFPNPSSNFLSVWRSLQRADVCP